MNEPAAQLEITFDSAVNNGGFQSWLDARRLAMTKLAAQLGLPLGRTVEIWLKGDVRLNGVLQLAEAPLFVDERRNLELELRIDRCTFTPRDIEACVCVD
jgi:hypothetical protein